MKMEVWVLVGATVGIMMQGRAMSGTDGMTSLAGNE